MIKQISMVDFRGHNRTLNFGPGHNRLRGPNEIGKSTVKEAIAFVWSGTDAAGVKNPDHLISEGKDRTEVSIVMENSTIVRVKRRGQTSTLKMTRNGFSPVPYTQTEFNNLLKLTPDAFMCCWNAGYFMALPQATQLAVLAELAKIDRRALLSSMLPSGTVIPAKVKLINPKIDADAIATERRQVQNVKASDEGALKQVQAQLAQLTGGGDVDIESYEKALNSLNAQLEAWDFYKKASSKYREDKIRWGESINREGGLQVAKLATRIPLPAEFDGLKTHLASIDKKLEAVQAGMTTLRAKFKPAPAPPKKPDHAYLDAGSICPKCGQKVLNAKDVRGEYEEQLIAYNKEAREVANFNEKVQEALKKGEEAERGLFADSIQVKREILDLERLLEGNKKRLIEIDKELAEISKIKEPTAPTKPEGEEEALRKEQLEISTALNVAKRQATQLTQLRNQQDLLNAAIDHKHSQILWLSALEKALKELPLAEAQELLKTLNVDGVQARLDEGNLIIAAGGIPYASLSSGRKMKVDLAFCASLKRASGHREPSWIFTDNSDLMDRFEHLLPPGVQVFSAEVAEDEKDLVVMST